MYNEINCDIEKSNVNYVIYQLKEQHVFRN